LQNFAILLVELQEVPVSPFLQPIEVPLDGSTTRWQVSNFSQFSVISILLDGVLCPIIQMINEDVKQD